MIRLPSNARRLLESARSAAGPSTAQRARADAAVRAQLAQHGLVDLPPLPSSPAHAGPGIASAALKLGTGALVIASAVVALQRVQHEDAPTPPRERAPAQAAPNALTAPAPTAEPAPISKGKASQRIRSGTIAPDTALRAELRLISSANELLQDARFDEALSVLARHGRLFPQGVLRTEREGLRVLSMCGLGSSDRTLRARDRYLQTAPQSPLAARVRAACDTDAERR